MVTQFNWVDLLILATLIFFAFEALGRPLIIEILDLISFLMAFLLSFNFYNIPAKFFEVSFQTPHGLTLVFGFMAVWFISEIVFYLLIKILLPKLPALKMRGSEILSVFPAFLRGLVFIALFLVMVATFPIQPSIKKAVLSSQIGSQILKYAYRLEDPVKNVFGGVTNDTLTFLTIKPKTSEKVNLGFQTTQFDIDETSENMMMNLVNKERVSRGLKSLEFDSKLRNIARAHSADMFQRGYFSHYSPEGETVADRASKAGIDFLVIGENLAFAPNVELAHKGLMNSEGHRVNILSENFGKIGIGVMDGGVYGEMFTQVFSN